MKTLRKVLSAAFVAVMLVFIATPARATTQGYTDCVNYWLGQCNQTLADSSWYEKPIIGAACTALIAGCGVTNL
jgi:hypothetical protein